MRFAGYGLWSLFVNGGEEDENGDEEGEGGEEEEDIARSNSSRTQARAAATATFLRSEPE